MKANAGVNVKQHIYALKHIESGEFICLLQNGHDYLACFSDGDTALSFRTELGLQEHVDLYGTTIDHCPFTHFWLDGANVDLEAEVMS